MRQSKNAQKRAEKQKGLLRKLRLKPCKEVIRNGWFRMQIQLFPKLQFRRHQAADFSKITLSAACLKQFNVGLYAKYIKCFVCMSEICDILF